MPMPHNISQTPKPLPRHQAAPAYSLPKGKVAIVAQNRMNKVDKKKQKKDNNNCKMQKLTSRTQKAKKKHVCLKTKCAKGEGFAQNCTATPSAHPAPTTS